MDTHQGRVKEFARFVDVEHGLVNRRIFADEAIYRVELERVFGRCWLYLAHESQIPNPGDFVTVTMGEEPILLCRGLDGKFNAFINTCRHRGNRVCRADQGNTTSFACPYHGWTYDTAGKLIGLPGSKELYHSELSRKDWGLPKVAKVDIYRGLIFGNLSPDAPSLEEYLGDMRWGLDLLFEQGEFVAVPGIARWVMQSNWKFTSDNAIGDMYHGQWTHRSAVMAGHRSGTGTAVGQLPRNLQRPGFTMVTEYGHGFNADYYEEARVDWSSPMAAWRRDAEIQRRLGPQRAKVHRANMLVFPNLFVNSGSRELMLRNPLSATSLEILKTTLVDRDATPEVRRLQVQASNRHFGPAGMFEQDDGENWDQSTFGARGAAAQQYDLNYSMAVGHGDFVDDEKGPTRIDSCVNEHAQLWMYQCWAEFMDATSWPELKATHSRPRGRL